MTSPIQPDTVEAAPAIGSVRSSSQPDTITRKIVEWLWRGKKVAEARAEHAQTTPQQLEYRKRALLLMDVANRTMEPVDHLQGGSGAPLAASLYVEACYWLLRNRAPNISSRQTLWAEYARPHLVSTGASSSEQWASLERWFCMDWSYPLLAELPEQEQTATAAQMRTAADQLLIRTEASHTKLTHLLISRGLRSGGAALVLAALLALIWTGIHNATRPPNLAEGKTWRTSSTLCVPKDGLCIGVPTRIFFHTLEEQNPWIEYDLGAPTSFSSLSIQNRSDTPLERAIPLVVEVSDVQSQFREVARKTEPFVTWKPQFSTQKARYLRLRVDRQSLLHLEAVEIYP